MPFAGPYETYAAAYATAENPATRTKPAIGDRNVSQKALTAQIRPLVATLQASPVMTNGKWGQLLIPIRDYTPTPSPIPATSPSAIVRSIAGRLIDLQLAAQGSRRGPAGQVRGRAVGRAIYVRRRGAADVRGDVVPRRGGQDLRPAGDTAGRGGWARRCGSACAG